MEQERSKYSGLPVTEEEKAEFNKAFTDIDELTEYLHKQSDKAYNKGTKLKRRNKYECTNT